MRDEDGAGTYDDDDRPAWRAGRDRPRRRPGRGPVARAFSLLKVALFLGPLTFVLAGSFVTDCGSRPNGAGLWAVLRAGACARNELVEGALALPDSLRLLRHVMN